MSTTARQVIELVKSLPLNDQRQIRGELAREPEERRHAPRRSLRRLANGVYFNPDGIPNEDPFFKMVAEIEEQRHRTSGPSAPEFD